MFASVKTRITSNTIWSAGFSVVVSTLKTPLIERNFSFGVEGFVDVVHMGICRLSRLLLAASDGVTAESAFAGAGNGGAAGIGCAGVAEPAPGVAGVCVGEPGVGEGAFSDFLNN